MNGKNNHHAAFVEGEKWKLKTEQKTANKYYNKTMSEKKNNKNVLLIGWLHIKLLLFNQHCVLFLLFVHVCVREFILSGIIHTFQDAQRLSYELWICNQPSLTFAFTFAKQVRSAMLIFG